MSDSVPEVELNNVPELYLDFENINSVKSLNTIDTPPEGNYIFSKLVKHQWFFGLSLLAVIANSLVLSLDSYSNTPSTTRLLRNANKFFTIVFTVEMICKLFGLGIKNYLRDEYNIFDGLLVVLSIGDLTLKELVQKEEGTSVITAFRMLRLLRIFKLATKS